MRRDLPIWLAFTGAKVALLASTAGRFGYFRDELYYIACSNHLDWGYVDHAPLSILILRLTRELAGDSVLSIRSSAILAGAAAILLIGLLTRMIGGGRPAQTTACLAALISPVYLVTGGGFFSMNAFDSLFWIAATVIVVHILHGRDRPWWIVFGAVVGLGLMNKISISFLGFGLAVALVASQHRRQLRSGWTWLGLSIAALLVLPNIL